ncbi:hypothetical protein BU23DRAFT_214547 [Bimuria novae-zelandiae CBS 107.79]|uniref:Uncharacterized protein n=1 Tax=Bimuria novae-zelandiae CBS 107.79 TaxID=1447943 RepID=A0A6A5V251_9PLEO|nr:hypothetical protein BU23DRAFT_214547 [Bimuria novae-zelandiae CBS 107.79]
MGCETSAGTVPHIGLKATVFFAPCFFCTTTPYNYSAYPSRKKKNKARNADDSQPCYASRREFRDPIRRCAISSQSLIVTVANERLHIRFRLAIGVRCAFCLASHAARMTALRISLTQRMEAAPKKTWRSFEIGV